MRKNVLILLGLVAILLLQTSFAEEHADAEKSFEEAAKDQGDKPKKKKHDLGASFEEFNKNLRALSKEDRLEFELDQSENVIAKWGELANDLRLCTNIEFNDTTA